MIKLFKGDQPEVLLRNASVWTKVVVEAFQRERKLPSSDKRKYNHPEIKGALLRETCGKCAYCESKLKHITYGDIEHIVPKSKDPEKLFLWKNLTIACDVCNTRKSDVEGLIDPYDVDPEEHFWHEGPLILARPGCDSALKTEKRLELNRASLFERRLERVKRLAEQLELIARVSDLETKRALVEDFLLEGESDKEFAALARHMIRRARGMLAETFGATVRHDHRGDDRPERADAGAARQGQGA